MEAFSTHKATVKPSPKSFLRKQTGTGGLSAVEALSKVWVPVMGARGAKTASETEGQSPAQTQQRMASVARPRPKPMAFKRRSNPPNSEFRR